MSETDFKIGERVFYFLPKRPRDSRPRDLYLPGVIVNITPKRVVFVSDAYPYPRAIVRSKLHRHIPATHEAAEG